MLGAALLKDLRLLARDRAGLVFLTIAPVVVITVAGLSLASLYGADPRGTSAYLLPVADEDGGRIGETVRARLAGESRVLVEEVADREAARDLVRRQVAGAALVIPPGTTAAVGRGEPAALLLYTDPVKYLEVANVRLLVEELRHGIEAAARARAAARLEKERAHATRARVRFERAAQGLTRSLEEVSARLRAARADAERRLAAAQAEATAAAAQARTQLDDALAPLRRFRTSPCRPHRRCRGSSSRRCLRFPRRASPARFASRRRASPAHPPSSTPSIRTCPASASPFSSWACCSACRSGSSTSATGARSSACGRCRRRLRPRSWRSCSRAFSWASYSLRCSSRSAAWPSGSRSGRSRGRSRCRRRGSCLPGRPSGSSWRPWRAAASRCCRSARS